MSRIGKSPIVVPASVKVNVSGKKVSVQGPKGKLDMELPRRTSLKVEGDKIVVSRDGEDAEAKAMHGLGRALVNNMVQGVSVGFSKKLEINGVGFKAVVQGNVVNLTLGYSHPINYPIPAQIKVTVEENTKVTIEGPSKQVVGQVAAEIRSYYPPEPYKGKGVKYSDEKIIRKEGKTVQ
jgi:large subunit ribosomal protein L6